MADPEDVLADSPADFDSSLAYALHPEMRRLLIVAIVGTVLTPVGLALFLGSAAIGVAPPITERVFGLLLLVAGALLLIGGLVGALFKLVVDANVVANTQTRFE